MDVLPNPVIIILQILGVWLTVSVVISAFVVIYLVIGNAIVDRMHDRRRSQNEQYRDEFFKDFDNYLIKQAEHEKFFNQIEEYRNDFS